MSKWLITLKCTVKILFPSVLHAFDEINQNKTSNAHLT